MVLPLALIAASHKDRPIDHAIRLGGMIGFAMPPFWMGLLLMLFFGLTLGLLPISGYGKGFFGHVVHLTLPALALALSGSFVELAVLSVVARFTALIPSCLAVFVLRRRMPDPPGFRVPLGPVIPLVALALCVWILSQAELRQLFWGTVALLSGWVFYGVRRFSEGRT